MFSSDNREKGNRIEDEQEGTGDPEEIAHHKIRRPGGLKLRQAVEDIKGVLSSLESKLSSLGLFSFREKKETNERIATCKNDIEKTRRSLSDAKRNFSSDINKQNASYDAEITKYKNDLSAKKKRLSEINEKLKKLN